MFLRFTHVGVSAFQNNYSTCGCSRRYRGRVSIYLFAQGYSGFDNTIVAEPLEGVGKHDSREWSGPILNPGEIEIVTGLFEPAPRS